MRLNVDNIEYIMTGSKCKLPDDCEIYKAESIKSVGVMLDAK